MDNSNKLPDFKLPDSSPGDRNKEVLIGGGGGGSKSIFNKDFLQLWADKFKEEQQMRSHFNKLAEITTGEQAGYYKWFNDNAFGFVENFCREKSEADLESFGKFIKQNQCFNNAQTIAYVNDKARYFGGYVKEPVMGLSIEHAFNVVDNKCYDFTARLHWPCEPLAWLGVEIPAKVLEQYREFRRKRGSLLTPIQYYYRYHISTPF